MFNQFFAFLPDLQVICHPSQNFLAPVVSDQISKVNEVALWDTMRNIAQTHVTELKASGAELPSSITQGWRLVDNRRVVIVALRFPVKENGELCARERVQQIRELGFQLKQFEN